MAASRNPFGRESGSTNTWPASSASIPARVKPADPDCRSGQAEGRNPTKHLTWKDECRVDEANPTYASLFEASRNDEGPAIGGAFVVQHVATGQSPICFSRCSRRSWASSDKVAIGRAS